MSNPSNPFWPTVPADTITSASANITYHPARPGDDLEEFIRNVRRENNRFLWRLGIGTFAIAVAASFVLAFAAVMLASR